MSRQSGNRSWFLLTLISIVITLAAPAVTHAAPELHIEPSPVEFGSVDLHDGFSTAAITISNIGDEPLEFEPEGIVLSGSTAFSFVDQQSTASLEVQTSRTYLLKFDPVVVKSNTANLRFYTNEPLYFPKNVTLSGTGLASRLSVTADPLEFAHKVITEQPSPARTITVRNTGNLPLDFTGAGIVISGADADDFKFEEPASTTTLSAESNSNTRELQVTFKPLSVGEKSAQVVITTTDMAQPTVTLQLSGQGLPERETTFHGPYNGHGPGVSTVGDGGDFNSLFDACMAVNDTPLTGGDWTFRIVSDLFEENNSFLGQPETNGNTITFRPALNTTATVTFTTTTWARYSGESAEGHFLLGNHYNKRLTPETPSVPISNVLIDGSQSPGGSDISLFFRRENLSGSCPVILVYGGCKNITLRKCNISTDVSGRPSYTPPFRTAAPVYIITQRLTETENPAEYTSENILIEGCVLKVGGTYGTAAIWHDGPPSYPLNAYYRFASGTKNLVIQNNKLDTINLGISLICPTSAFVKNNYFMVSQGTSLNEGPVVSIGTDALSIYPGETSITVTNNIIEYQRGSAGTGSGAGIGIRNRSWPSTYHVTNNIISGLEASSDPIKTRAGIIANGAQETTAVIAQNSIYIKASDNLPSAGKCYGIGTDMPYWWTQNFFYPTEINMFAHNNVVHVEQVGASAIHHEGTMGMFVSDNNDLSVVAGAYTSTWNQIGPQGWTETHATLDERRTTTGQDMNSVSVNPFEPVSPGLGTWTRAGSGPDGGPAVADLHFSNYPGSVYLAPKIDGLDTDIDGDPRPEAMVIIGADEFPHHRSHVDGWGIY